MLSVQINGSIVSNAIRRFPLAGKDVSAFILKMLRDRGEPVPPQEVAQLVRLIKEHFWCVRVERQIPRPCYTVIVNLAFARSSVVLDSALRAVSCVHT
jgi:hypothetical protein